MTVLPNGMARSLIGHLVGAVSGGALMALGACGNNEPAATTPTPVRPG